MLTAVTHISSMRDRVKAPESSYPLSITTDIVYTEPYVMHYSAQSTPTRSDIDLADHRPRLDCGDSIWTDSILTSESTHGNTRTTDSCDGSSTNYDSDNITLRNSHGSFPTHVPLPDALPLPGAKAVTVRPLSQILEHFNDIVNNEKEDFRLITLQLLQVADMVRLNNIPAASNDLLLLRSILSKLSVKEHLANYGLGLFSSGMISTRDNCTKKNMKEAFYQFKSASKLGHIEATYRLAQCYESGRGTSRSDSKALFLYRKAAVRLHPGAMYRLGRALVYGELDSIVSIREGVNWVGMSCKYATPEHKEGFYLLACIYEVGLSDLVFPDHRYMLQLLLQGCDMGCLNCLLRLAEMYETGYSQILKIDINKSIYLYRCACGHESVESMYHLGRILLTDNSSSPDMKLEGLFWMEKAAALEYQPAYAALIYVFDHQVLDTSEMDSNRFEKYRVAVGQNDAPTSQRFRRKGSLQPLQSLKDTFKCMSLRTSSKTDSSDSDAELPARDAMDEAALSGENVNLSVPYSQEPVDSRAFPDERPPSNSSWLFRKRHVLLFSLCASKKD